MLLRLIRYLPSQGEQAWSKDILMDKREKINQRFPGFYCLRFFFKNLQGKLHAKVEFCPERMSCKRVHSGEADRDMLRPITRPDWPLQKFSKRRKITATILHRLKEIWPYSYIMTCKPGCKSPLLLMQMSKLIVSHMSKQPFQLSYWPVIAMATTLTNSYVQLVPAFPLAALVNGLVLAGYLHYVTHVVSEICDYLKIRCFKIPVVQDERKE